MDLSTALESLYTGMSLDEELEECGLEMSLEEYEAMVKKQNKKSKKPAGNKLVHKGEDTQNVTTLGKWRYNLPEKREVALTACYHAIRYKESDWCIPERGILFNIELVKMPGEARGIAEKVTDGDTEKMEKAASGEERWYKFITYESVPYKAARLGYARVALNENGKMVFNCYFDNEAIKYGNFNEEWTKKKFRDTVRKMLSSAKKSK